MALKSNVIKTDGGSSKQNTNSPKPISVRGSVLEGIVASTSMDKTVIVEREYVVFIPKYERYMKRRSRVPAHVPQGIELEVGDQVKIAETRPISKTKSHVVVEITKRISDKGDGV
ncbi:MAG: 30S ribosomal protein S17 [Halobacteriales archaeon]